MSAIRWRHALAIGALLAIFTALLVGSSVPDPDRHDRVLAALQTLVLDDAALQRDVLRARAGLLSNYDPIVRGTAGLRKASAELRGEDDAEVDAALAAVRSAVDNREADAEAFKSRNALLRNSIAYFNRAGHEIAGHGPAGDAERLAAAAVLSTIMSRFVDDPSPALRAELSTALARLNRIPGAWALSREAEAMETHGRLAMDVLPQVDGALTRLLDGSIIGAAAAFRELYVERHGKAVARAQYARVLLYIAAILVLAYLAIVFRRLRERGRILRMRLDLERVVTEISARFINLPRERSEHGMRAGLARLAEGLDLAGAALRFEDGTAYAAGNVTCSREREPDASSSRDAHGLRVALTPSGKKVGELEIETRRTKRWSADDLALLRVIAEIFANAIERFRGEAQREALEGRLRRAERVEALGTLAGGIAHNFNNILSAVLGYAEMALDALPGSALARQHVAEVIQAGERAREIVAQIHAFGRRGEPGRQAVPLRPLLDETIRLLQATLPTTIEMRTEIARDLVAWGDAAQIQQVIVNLCTNAAEAMGGIGTLEIEVDGLDREQPSDLSHGSLGAGNWVRLRVKDTGEGMDEPTLARIFEPFFTTKSDGTGLGLSSVHGIVADHGGALNVSSRPGKGSLFEAFFPRMDAEKPSKAGETEAATRTGNGETIMFVDDEDVLVRLGEDVLSSLGFEPVGYGDAKTALAAFAASPDRFDLVLTDELMPGMTGSQLAAALHRLRPDLPIVLMTGHRVAAPLEDLAAIGVREVLRKPLRARDFARSLAQWLR